MKNPQDELIQNKIELGLVQKVFCTKKEQDEFKSRGTFPAGVHREDNVSCFRYLETELSEQEVKDFHLCKQTLYLRSIRNGVFFFVILTVIFMIVIFAIMFNVWNYISSFMSNFN